MNKQPETISIVKSGIEFIVPHNMKNISLDDMPITFNITVDPETIKYYLRYINKYLIKTYISHCTEITDYDITFHGAYTDHNNIAFIYQVNDILINVGVWQLDNRLCILFTPKNILKFTISEDEISEYINKVYEDIKNKLKQIAKDVYGYTINDDRIGPMDMIDSNEDYSEYIIKANLISGSSFEFKFRYHKDTKHIKMVYLHCYDKEDMKEE